LPHPLPNALLESLQHLNGFDEDAFIAAHEAEKQMTSVRFNPAKPVDQDFIKMDLTKNIPWSTNGIYLSKRPSFTLDPLFHAGAYYVQEASSMFLEEVIKQTVNLSAQIKVLDLCAAPGGKSTLLQSLISKESFLVSNEVIKSRVNILSENITKWGASNVLVTNNDPKDFQRLPAYFDVIVVDAPCSGSGLFRKDNEAISEWSPQNVALCCQRQQRILADIKDSLKPGGILIYSTCSYSQSENEDIVSWLVNENKFQSVELSIPSDWGIIKTSMNNFFGYRFYPDKVLGEGFFIAAFRKNQSSDTPKLKPLKSKSPQKKQASLSLPDWINGNEPISFFNWKDDVLLMPEMLKQELPYLQSNLYIKKIGVNIGSIIRGELIPSHELAMSSSLQSSLIPHIDLEYEMALQFLRHENFNVDGQQSGWVLVKYGDLALGFIKVMKNRINNYYPREWRILNK
jgi:16S rRNA C967 or C1407 C5-methylase (RsmB/RsmF family)/NOL1/NOP2/fmu family ribosome biogenesis protein